MWPSNNHLISSAVNHDKSDVWLVNIPYDRTDKGEASWTPTLRRRHESTFVGVPTGPVRVPVETGPDGCVQDGPLREWSSVNQVGQEEQGSQEEYYSIKLIYNV